MEVFKIFERMDIQDDEVHCKRSYYFAHLNVAIRARLDHA